MLWQSSMKCYMYEYITIHQGCFGCLLTVYKRIPIIFPRGNGRPIATILWISAGCFSAQVDPSTVQKILETLKEKSTMEHRPTASIPDIVFLSPTGKMRKDIATISILSGKSCSCCRWPRSWSSLEKKQLGHALLSPTIITGFLCLLLVAGIFVVGFLEYLLVPVTWVILGVL